mmetsp:Transcript_30774/g.100164  ORF Transcript_30774/g.100164 Transcript_30774/m.100164 type:complete len:327 (-) Transcript_30774:3886-4866(-)
MQADAVCEAVFQRTVRDLLQSLLQLVMRDVQELLRSLVRGGVSDEVERCEAGLPSRAHKNQGGASWAVRANRRIRRLVHGEHPWAVMLAWKALNMALKRHRTNRRSEVEQAARTFIDAEPIRQITSVGQRCAETHDTHIACRLFTDVSHPRDNHFQNRTAISPEEVNLVDDHQGHFRHVRSRLPCARYTVPLLWGGNDEIRREKRSKIRGVVACELHHALAKSAAQSPTPICDPLADESLQRRDVDNLEVRSFRKHSQDGQLGADSLSRAGRRTEKHIDIRMKESVECLRLHWVEMRESSTVQLNERRMLQSLQRQRIEVQELRVC